MSLCPESAKRAAMTDDEFWAYVSQDRYDDRTEDDGPDVSPDDEVPVKTPCPECGAAGACAWDVEGRPLIHAVDNEER